MNTAEIDHVEQARDTVRCALRNFIAGLGDLDLRRLCMNGAIWAPPMAPTLEAESLAFSATGPTIELAVKKWAASQGLVLLIDFNGLADLFCADGEAPDQCATEYRTDVGRKELLTCVDVNFDGCWDSYLERSRQDD